MKVTPHGTHHILIDETQKKTVPDAIGNVAKERIKAPKADRILGIVKGRVENDPRKSIILKNNIIGMIVRLAMRLFGQGEKVATMQKIASDLDLKETRGVIDEFVTKKKEHPGKASDFRMNVEGVSVGKLPKGEGLKECQALVSAGRELNSEEIAKAHLLTKNYESGLKPLTSGDGTEWKPVRVKIDEYGVHFEEGSVSPTSERAMGVSDDLNNIYYNISQTGHISISCGVINTEEKAKQFMAAVGFAMKERQKRGLPEQPLRISMHQLNAMGLPFVGEASLITNQKRMVDFIEQNIQKYVDVRVDHPVIAHVNQCMNGFVNAPIGENNKSHDLNRSGVAVQAEWAAKDAGIDCTAVKARESKIRGLKAELAERNSRPELGAFDAYLKKQEMKIEDIKDKIRTTSSEQEIKQLKLKLSTAHERKEAALAKRNEVLSGDEIEKLQAAIKEEEKALKGELKALTRVFQKHEPKDVKVEAAMRLMANQLGMEKELGLKPLHAAELMGVQLLLDRMLGTVTEINCKSGLDRTGFVRSLNNAIQQKLNEGKSYEEVMKFLLKFEGGAAKLDAVLQKEYKEKGDDFDISKYFQEHPDYKEIADFQGKVFAELKGVGFDITGRSTGVPGFKWHHDKKGVNPYEKNLHPMPYIPMLIYDSNTTKWIQMKSENNLTSDGNAVLMGLSKKRGG